MADWDTVPALDTSARVCFLRSADVSVRPDARGRDADHGVVRDERVRARVAQPDTERDLACDAQRHRRLPGRLARRAAVGPEAAGRAGGGPLYRAAVDARRRDPRHG